MDDDSATPAAEGPADISGQAADAADRAVAAEAAALAEENARLKAELDRARPRGRVWGAVRRILVVVLVILTALGAVATTTAFWATRTVFDTDRFVAAVAPVAQNPTVQANVATRLTDQLFATLDVEARVRAALPAQAQALAAPITNGVKGFVRDRLQTFLASETFQQVWTGAITVAHQKIVALLRDDLDQLPNVVLTSGEVRISLIAALARGLQGLGQDVLNLLGINATIPDFPAEEDPQVAIDRLSTVLGRPLPDDFGQITIMTVDQLEQLQGTTKQLERLPWVLLLVTIVMLVLALALSPNRRRTLVALGFAVAVALFLASRLIDRIDQNLIEAVKEGSGQAAVRDMVNNLVGSLRAIGVWVLVIGLIVAIVAFIAGRKSWVEAAGRGARSLTARTPDGTTRLAAWSAAHAEVLRIVAIALAALIVFLTGLSLIAILVVGALLGLVLWGLWAAERRVHPPDEPDDAESAVTVSDQPPAG
jgi:hypothetical protein